MPFCGKSQTEGASSKIIDVQLTPVTDISGVVSSNKPCGGISNGYEPFINNKCGS